MKPLTRVFFAVVALVGLATGAVLLSAPGSTADYFPWPVNPPQTAVFLGAGYLGTGITLLLMLLLARSWAEMRLIVPPIVVFALAMIGATLLHADRFLWDRPVTWIWLGLYGVVVLGCVVVGLIERGQRRARIGVGLMPGERIVLVVIGLLTLGWAAPMYVAPDFGLLVWPWGLTHLTARVVAGWIAVGATLALVGGEANDARGIRLAMLGWVITAALFLLSSVLNLAAFTDDVKRAIFFTGLAASIYGALWLLVRVQRRVAIAPLS